jgi:hypothetical protein
MFRSFYLAGFECATGYNVHGEWIDQVAATQHDHHVEDDYERLAEVDIHAVREAIRWPLVDHGGRYDFSSVLPFVNAALRHQFDVIWDLFHYGYPDDLDPFSSEFVERFGAYCRAAARFVCEHMPGPYFFTPINEPSYFSWAAGEVGRFAPHEKGRGFELKVNLARACLRAVSAIRAVCPSARIVNVDPICRVVPKTSSAEELAYAQRFNEEFVFQFWDMMSGRLLPELGGRPDYLDIAGLNYYWTNQWELGSEDVPLAEHDPRRVPFTRLVRRVWDRYQTDIVITETSALGEARAPWVHELSAMAEQLLENEVELGGICLYPILGMPEWHARDQWTHMGLWDLEHEQQVLQRRICAPMLHALRTAQSREYPRGVNRRQRTFSLSRTGNVPFVVHGTLVWQIADADERYELRLIRSDQPYRLWVAGIAVRTDAGLIRHVSTAAELPMLVDVLRWYTPATIALEHGATPSWPPEDSTARWQRDLDGLLEQRSAFERFPMYHVHARESHRRVGGRY